MYTVLIVEDEFFVGVGLRNMIRWSEMDMKVIGEARNGQEGLDMYLEYKPDFILTDVKMPVMNGIDMIAKIREKDSATRIVVLSCYEDYDLVREAFKLGISDYILKSKMMPAGIEAIIKKIHQELEQNLQKSSTVTDEERGKKKDTAEKCRDFIMNGFGSPEEFRALAQFLPIREEHVAIGLMEVFPKGKKGITEGKRQVILELTQQLLTEKQYGVIHWEKENRFLLILNLPTDSLPGGREALLGEFVQQINVILRTYVNGKVVLGLSRLADSYEKLAKLYTEAVKAEREAVFLEEEIMFYGNTSGFSKYKEILSGFAEQIQQAGWLTQVCRQQTINEIEYLKKAENTDVDRLKEAFSRWIHRTSFDCAVQREGVAEIALEAAVEIRAADSLLDMIEGFEKYLATMNREWESGMVSAEVAQAVIYIRENCCKKSISLSDVAEHVGMSKNYFSALFKKETGQGVNDYVNRMRIGKACELLENSNMRSCEIFLLVGFQDESYFSRVFKKVVGVRPNEYRRGMLIRSDMIREEKRL